MSDSKKYYYLKLHENFFEREEIKIIEAQPNGYEYSLILLKMYLKSLKREGKLMVSNYIPYSPETLAKVLGHNVDTVRAAINIFKEFQLLEVLDNGSMYLLEIQNFIGKSSSEADRKRSQRMKIEEEKKLLKSGSEWDKSTDKCPIEKKEPSKIGGSEFLKGQMSDNSPPETETEQETEQEKEKETEQETEIKRTIVNEHTIARIFNCPLDVAVTIFNVTKKYHRGKSVVAVVEEKLKIIKEGNFKNFYGALVTAIKEDWSSNIMTTKNKFNNFEPRENNFKDIEERLLGWDA